jgi:hypothetical protein
MAALVIADMKISVETYDQVAKGIGEAMKHAPGFLMHFVGKTPEGWRVFEVWNSSKEANRFFADEIHPNIPADQQPKRTVVELHNIILPT